MWENNLNIPNVHWEDYVSRAPGGVYRGFELPPPLTPAEKAEAERRARLENWRSSNGKSSNGWLRR
jgi:hypothetical protein